MIRRPYDSDGENFDRHQLENAYGQASVNRHIEAWYRRHDQAAARAIYRDYAGQVARVVKAELHQAVAARFSVDDVVQTVFAAAFTKLTAQRPSFASNGAFAAWLMRFAKFKTVKHCQRETAAKRDVKREVHGPDEGTGAFGFETLVASRARNPLELLMKKEFMESLMGRLDRANRLVLRMYLDGYTQDEIAGVSEVTPRQIRRRLRKIHDVCRDLYKSHLMA